MKVKSHKRNHERRQSKKCKTLLSKAFNIVVKCNCNVSTQKTKYLKGMEHKSRHSIESPIKNGKSYKYEQQQNRKLTALTRILLAENLRKRVSGCNRQLIKMMTQTKTNNNTIIQQTKTTNVYHCSESVCVDAYL